MRRHAPPGVLVVRTLCIMEQLNYDFHELPFLPVSRLGDRGSFFMLKPKTIYPSKTTAAGPTIGINRKRCTFFHHERASFTRPAPSHLSKTFVRRKTSPTRT